jgi:hypothetical protein
MDSIQTKITAAPQRKYNTDQNKWADYIELLCLLTNGGYIKVDELQNRLNDEAIGDSNDALGTSDVADFDENLEKADDKLTSVLRQRFEFLAQRQRHFSEKYPFVINLNTYAISIKSNISEDIFQPYLFFLLASNLDYCRSRLHELSNLFERISLSISEAMFQQQFQALHFGTARSHDSVFRGNGLERLEILAEQLNLNLRTDIDRNVVRANTNGDFGIDIVCYQKWGDYQSNSGLIFIQCGCGQDWVDKQLEAHPVIQESFFQFRNKPATVLFIPHNFRDTSNKWAYPTVLSDVIIVDRWRLLHADFVYSQTDIIAMRELVEELLAEKIDYFS